MRRLPARERRCRRWSPEDASIGAVPFQEAKCAAVANRRMSPMSPSSRAAPEGPIPFSAPSELPVATWRYRAVDELDLFLLFLERGLYVEPDDGAGYLVSERVRAEPTVYT